MGRWLASLTEVAVGGEARGLDPISEGTIELPAPGLVQKLLTRAEPAIAMRAILFELCAETIDACLAARDGGAHRIELCEGLSEGGVTPSHGLMSQAIERSGLPVHVLVRPRGGGFVYSATELEVMRGDIAHARELGAAGVVIGVLLPDGRIDAEMMRALVQWARPMEVTFHRAFDQTPSLLQALEDVVATGADRILTSGGQPDVVMGTAMLAQLVGQAGKRIAIAAGGGLRLDNAAALARATGARQFHGSLRRRADALGAPSSRVGESMRMGQAYIVDADEVRRVIGELEQA